MENAIQKPSKVNYSSDANFGALPPELARMIVGYCNDESKRNLSLVSRHFFSCVAGCSYEDFQKANSIMQWESKKERGRVYLSNIGLFLLSTIFFHHPILRVYFILLRCFSQSTEQVDSIALDYKASLLFLSLILLPLMCLPDFFWTTAQAASIDRKHRASAHALTKIISSSSDLERVRTIIFHKEEYIALKKYPSGLAQIKDKRILEPLLTAAISRMHFGFALLLFSFDVKLNAAQRDLLIAMVKKAAQENDPSYEAGRQLQERVQESLDQTFEATRDQPVLSPRL